MLEINDALKVFKVSTNPEDDRVAINHLNLEIKEGDFVTIIGGNGSGKSTLMNAIAGAITLDSGTIKIAGKDVTKLPEYKRAAYLGRVFQDPNMGTASQMNIEENMMLATRRTKKKTLKWGFNKGDREACVNKLKSLNLGLENRLEQKVGLLSGGQRQRVAMGRAIVRDAKVFLMDEPLSNLDAKLRVQMRSELIKIHESLGTTTIYVTHDQIEAMTMASRIVVMRDGWIQQIGAPKEIYDNPDNIFVGGFIGTPPMNFVNGVVGKDGIFECGSHKYGVVRLQVPQEKFELLKEKNYLEKELVMGIRPEDISDQKDDFEEHPEWTGEYKVDISELLGAESQIRVKLPGKDSVGQAITAKVPARIDIHTNDMIKLMINMNKCHFFDPETEKRIKRD